MPNEQSPRNEVVDGPIRVFNTLAEAQLASPKYLGQVFVTLDGYLVIPRGYGIGHTGDSINGFNPITGDVNLPGGLAVFGSVTAGTVKTGLFLSLVEAKVAAGAVDADGNYLTTTIATVAPIALTLSDGQNGQLKFIAMITDGGDATLTPAHFANGSTIVFNDVGDSVLLQFLGGKWQVMSNYGCAIA